MKNTINKKGKTKQNKTKTKTKTKKRKRSETKSIPTGNKRFRTPYGVFLSKLIEFGFSWALKNTLITLVDNHVAVFSKILNSKN